MTITIGPKLEGVLYHYTSQRILLNIVENNCLWVSHVYYMNDEKEIKLAANLFKKVVAERKRQVNNSLMSEFLKEVESWVDQLIGIPHYVFVFSITEKGNLLSQWRSYTPHGTGISIGFNKPDLEKLAQLNEFELIKCIYELEDQKSVLNNSLNDIVAQFNNDIKNLDVTGKPNGQKFSNYLTKFTGNILRTFCRIKDSTFREEKEWRLVSKYFDKYIDPKIKFRSGKTTLIPYIELYLSNIRDDGYLFEQVYVGPSPNFELSMTAVANYLSNKKACKMTINSQSPYREI